MSQNPCGNIQDTYSSQVRIRLLGVQTAVVLDVLESLVHQPAVAALVALWSGAVYQVLLAQRHQCPGLPEVLPLHSSGGAKGPAGATLSLEAKQQKENCSDQGKVTSSRPKPHRAGRTGLSSQGGNV